jgi:hypothetical protein
VAKAGFRMAAWLNLIADAYQRQEATEGSGEL